ncbi:MAG TPA: hypothetical protein VI874_01425, partial [Candidatus Norongarragalinales archaeon]|nr:hypothetical protein [Candidatus Norongarragalinales archaeon]
NSDRVVVHVIAYAPEGSWIRFRKNDRVYKAYAFDLRCNLQGNACGEESLLSQNVQLSLFVPENATVRSETVSFNASLTESYRSELESGDFLAIFQEQAENFQESFFPSTTTPNPVGTSTPVANPLAKPPLSGSQSPTLPPLRISPSPSRIPSVLTAQDASLSSPAPTSPDFRKKTVKTESNRDVPKTSLTPTPLGPLVETGEPKPFSALIPLEFKDVIFVIGILSILGVLLILGKIFPEKSKGLGNE